MRLVAGGLAAGGDGLNFTAGAALAGTALVERLVGVAATTIGGTVLASREVFVEGTASTIRIGSSIDPVRLARGVAVISLRIGPLIAAAAPAELDETAAGGWKLPALAGDVGGGTVAGPIIA